MAPVPDIDAITKLFEVVLIRLLEPLHKKRMARATAEEMRILARAEIDVEKIRLEGKAELEQLARRLLPHSSAVEAVEGEIVAELEPTFLLTRVRERMQFQEAKRQLNVEQVVLEAANELRNERASGEPVDEDWIARLFGTVQDVSSPQMQKLWAKILAGEVKQPGSFSLRCLETVRNLSQEEAKAFAALGPYVVNAQCVLHKIGDFESRSDVDFARILRLSEAGLLNVGPQINFEPPISLSKAVWTLADLEILISSAWGGHTLAFPAYVLTSVGTQLMTLFYCDADRTYARALVTALRQSSCIVETFECVRDERGVSSRSQVDLFPLGAPPDEPVPVARSDGAV
jgi:hypothetical protein